MTGALSNARILITRPEQESKPVATLLGAMGAEVICIPTIEVHPANSDEISQVQKNIHAYQWIVFTSKNAVRYFLKNFPVPENNRPKIAAVGKTTGQTIAQYNWPVDFIGAGKGAETLAREFHKKVGFNNLKILYPCSHLAKTRFSTIAMENGADHIHMVHAYRTVAPTNLKSQKLYPYHIAIFYSESAVNNYVNALSDRSPLKHLWTVSIGLTTSQSLKSRGFTHIQQAGSPSISAIIEAVLRSWKHNKERTEL